jgi:glutathione peroxidase
MIKNKVIGSAAALFVVGVQAVAAGIGQFSFTSIEGGALDTAAWEGKPVLVVNSASRCGFTPQYNGMQDLYDRYRDQGLVVLAVPSQDFRQELSTAEEVKDFCAVNFDLDFPMTDITNVRGDAAHPFYQWVKQETGFEPKWNFHKVLIGPDGEILGTYDSLVKPTSDKITKAVEQALAGN